MNHGLQLADLASAAALDAGALPRSWHDAVLRSRLLRAMRRMDPARDSVGFSLVVALKSLHSASWAPSAAATPPAGSRRARSFTASAHSPHSQSPQKDARTPRMYDAVQSSPTPQHAQRTVSTAPG